MVLQLIEAFSAQDIQIPKNDLLIRAHGHYNGECRNVLDSKQVILVLRLTIYRTSYDSAVNSANRCIV